MRKLSILTGIAIAVTLGTLASAQPVLEPTPPRRDAPVVGKVRMRDQLIDLTRETVQSGGPAHEVGKGTALLIGDVEVKPRETHQHARTR